MKIAIIGHVDLGATMAIGSHTGTGDFDGSFHRERVKEIEELICDIEILRDPPKLAFINYWKKIINIISLYKSKLLTFVYVFIRPIIHIRVFSALY